MADVSSAVGLPSTAGQYIPRVTTGNGNTMNTWIRHGTVFPR